VADNTDQIKRIAKDVYRVLGSGFSEDVYDRVMQVGLRMGKFRYEGQKVVELKYKNHCVGSTTFAVCHEAVVAEFALSA
jgi:GxxExxY protein